MLRAVTQQEERCSTAGSLSLSLFPTMTPPLNVVVNGERKTLVVCLASDLSEDALGTIWFSNGNGSLLEAFTYGISREDDGTFSTVSQISISTKEFESWDMVACYVAQNKTSRPWSNTSLQISEENMEDLCLDENQEGQDQTLAPELLHSRSQILLLLAIRILLFKLLLFDVLMTCCILYKREEVPLPLTPPNCSAVHPHRVRTGSVPVNCYYG
ncbi:pre T-cell antigen receptor alpha isoform X2 [Rhineura floridana]|uniref:pre T-cell antigen receptor alpha isoform X2 n=1 Tax=Rhineura floridana TaxID=261503 RepID=UPI002AC863DE|nr:pre T-cell antigen receptor alpha isoform X2 [Rhineura floridana]